MYGPTIASRCRERFRLLDRTKSTSARTRHRPRTPPTTEPAITAVLLAFLAEEVAFEVAGPVMVGFALEEADVDVDVEVALDVRNAEDCPGLSMKAPVRSAEGQPPGVSPPVQGFDLQHPQKGGVLFAQV